MVPDQGIDPENCRLEIGSVSCPTGKKREQLAPSCGLKSDRNCEKTKLWLGFELILSWIMYQLESEQGELKVLDSSVTS